MSVFGRALPLGPGAFPTEFVLEFHIGFAVTDVQVSAPTGIASDPEPGTTFFVRYERGPRPFFTADQDEALVPADRGLPRFDLAVFVDLLDPVAGKGLVPLTAVETSQEHQRRRDQRESFPVHDSPGQQPFTRQERREVQEQRNTGTARGSCGIAAGTLDSIGLSGREQLHGLWPERIVFHLSL